MSLLTFAVSVPAGKEYKYNNRRYKSARSDLERTGRGRRTKSREAKESGKEEKERELTHSLVYFARHFVKSRLDRWMRTMKNHTQ